MFEYIFKIAVVGMTKIGKTYLLRKYVEDEPILASSPTIGVDFFIKKHRLDGKSILLQFWDISGRKQFRSIIDVLLKGTTASLLLFNKKIPVSFKEIREFWIPSLRRVAPHLFYKDYLPQVFLLNYENYKTKNVAEEVRMWEISSLVQSENLEYIDLSAGNSTTFNEVICKLIKNIIKNRSKKKNNVRWLSDEFLYPLGV